MLSYGTVSTYNLLGFKGSPANFSIARFTHYKYYLKNTCISHLNFKTIGLMHILILFC